MDNKYTIARKLYWTKQKPEERKKKARQMALKKWENMDLEARARHSHKMLEGKKRSLDIYYKSME